MEPRHSWQRNRAIAEGFCYYDEQVRIAETVLAQAQTARQHALAAFAVSLGRDRSAADLLGLAERDVRAARRSVGRKDARIVADELLASFHRRAVRDDPEGRDHTDEPGARASADPLPLSALDAAVAEGWRNGADLHALAAAIGVEVNTVVDRLKRLSTQGLLPDPDSPAAPRGRHRRTDDSENPTPPSPPAGQPNAREREEADGEAPLDSWAVWETEFSVPVARLSDGGEFGAAEQQGVSGGELSEDAGYEVGAGAGGEGREDGAGVPAGGGRGGAGAGGEVFDEGPAGQWLGAGDLRGQYARGFWREAGGEGDPFVADQLAAQSGQDRADGFVGSVPGGVGALVADPFQHLFVGRPVLPG